MNECAISAARDDGMITPEIIETVSKNSRRRQGDTIFPKKKELVAYHEAGHAIVVRFIEYDMLRKIPSSRAGTRVVSRTSTERRYGY